MTVLCIAMCSPLRSQDQKKEFPPNIISNRFSGVISTAAFANRPVKVNLANYHFSNHQHLDAIERPFPGLMIVQLRGGPVTTVVDGKRQLRHEGEFWTVSASQQMGIITDNDAGVVQVFFVSEDSSASMKFAPKKYPRDSLAPNQYTKLSDGVFERTSYVSGGNSAYTVEVRDMIVGPGVVSNRLFFEDPAVIEIRSGTGRMVQSGKSIDLKAGSTAMASPGESIWVDTRSSRQRITFRISIIHL